MTGYAQGRVYARGRGKAKTWWLEYWHRGERFRESSKSPHRHVAVDMLKARLGEGATTGRVLGPSAERVTLRDLLDMLAADRKLNGRRSVAPVQHLLEHFGADFKAMGFTLDTLTGYVSQRLASGVAPATARNEMLALGRALRLAHRAGRLPQPPCMPTIRVQNVRKGFFAPDEVTRLLAELPEHLRSYVETLAITGWRRSEVAGLRWRNVDWEAGELRLESGTTKNGDGRAYPFTAHPRLAELLREQREATARFEREHERVVPWVFHRGGHKLNGWCYRAWRKACEQAGVPGRLMHDLRRSCARDLIRSGVPEGVTMKLCGWRTRSVLARYDIVNTTDLEAAVGKLAEYRAQSSEGGTRVLPMRKGKVS